VVVVAIVVGKVVVSVVAVVDEEHD